MLCTFKDFQQGEKAKYTTEKPARLTNNNFFKPRKTIYIYIHKYRSKPKQTTLGIKHKKYKVFMELII